jgi:hypothetical protein
MPHFPHSGMVELVERKQWSQNAQPLFFSTSIPAKDQRANFTPLSYNQAILRGFFRMHAGFPDKIMIHI